MKILEYVSQSQRCPFRDWLKTLDTLTKARIQARIFRFEQGNLGDHKALGGGLYEARLFFGPGYRVYFHIDNGIVIVLLAGGDKSRQDRDISKAREYLTDYLEGAYEQKK